MRDWRTTTQNRLRSVDRPTVWSLNYLCLLAAAAVAWALVGYYGWFIRPFVALPADILMWSENELRRRRHQVANGAPALHPSGGG